jgi:hypothetical protein
MEKTEFISGSAGGISDGGVENLGFCMPADMSDVTSAVALAEEEALAKLEAPA